MPRTSRLAWLLQAAMLLVAAGAAAWFWLHWAGAPVRAVVGAMAIFLIGPIFITLEFLLLAVAGRPSIVPVPTIREYLGAWFTECCEVYRVFYWRQPFRWRQFDDFLPAEQSGRRGVVLVHGFLCNRGFWNPWMQRLQAEGRPYLAVNLEPVFGTVDGYAAEVDAAVRRVTVATGLPPVLVCHSMGGLAARAWLRHCGEPHRVHHLITIGTPHEGTWLGRFSFTENGQEMHIGSEWLLALAIGERTATMPPLTCWYSNGDNTVFPAETAMYPGADNRFVPAIAHVDLAFHHEVVDHAFAIFTGSAGKAGVASAPRQT